VPERDGDPPQALVDLLHELDADRTFLIERFAGRLLNKTADAATYVALLLFARVDTGMQAVGLLLQHGLTTEAGVITLSMFEMKLDMLYVGTDAARGDFWLTHANPLRQPWKVTHKIDALYTGEAREWEQATFAFLSAIKHGNPVSGPAGFPERGSRELWEIKTGGFEDSTTLVLSLITGHIARAQLLDAGLAICRVHERLGVHDPATELEIRRRRGEVMALLDNA
jgi:hypothetical protein